MSLNVISNYAANVAHRYLQSADMAATSSLAKLSSGQRIVSAKDDAAGLAIGSRLALQVTALQQASTNTTQATSMLQVADGALSKIGDILTRMKTLAVQAQSGQLGSTERSMIARRREDHQHFVNGRDYWRARFLALLRQQSWRHDAHPNPCL